MKGSANVTGARNENSSCNRCRSGGFDCDARIDKAVRRLEGYRFWNRTAVIGPITATRYRFIMIPFFAILSGFSCAGVKSTPDVTNGCFRKPDLGN